MKRGRKSIGIASLEGEERDLRNTERIIGSTVSWSRRQRLIMRRK